MRSYLWQWFCFSLICFNFGCSDGKPILSNLIQRVGKGLQKAVRSSRSATPVSSSTLSTNSHINEEDSVSSKSESDSELKKLSDEELMAELEKMADSDPEGTMGAKETLDGAGLLSLFAIWFQQLSLLGRRTQAVGDSDTEITKASLLSLSPLARWFKLRFRRKPEPTSKYIGKTKSRSAPITPIIKPTAQKIVQKYVVDEKGVPTHLVVDGHLTPLTTIAKRLLIVENPEVQTLPPSPPFTTGAEKVLPLTATPVSVSRDVITPPAQSPQITPKGHQQVSIGQPPIPRQSFNSLLLVPGAIFQRDDEPTKRVYFDRKRNAYVPAPSQN